MGVAGKPDSEALFGRLLVEQGLAKPEHVDECLLEIARLAAQGVTPLPKLGELLARRGCISTSQYDATLRVAESTPPSRSMALLPEKEAPLPKEVAEAARIASNQFGNFVLVKQIGQGGFGTVFRAWQRNLGRFVALMVVEMSA